MTRIFHVSLMKHDRDGMDWRVSTNAATKQYIAAQRANDDADFQDRLPQYFQHESDAVFRARELAQTYAPAQVVHHMRPTTVPVSAIPHDGR